MRKIFFISTIFISIILATANSYAFSYQYAKHTLYTPSSQTTDGTVYAASQTIVNNSTVDGDYYCAGQHVTINGIIDGDVLCAAQTITINGMVSGNVRLVAQDVVINGEVTDDASIAAQTITIGAKGAIGRDFSAFSQSLEIDGTIYRDAQALVSQNALITGTIGRNADIRVDQGLILASTAHINGSLTYTSTNDASIRSELSVSGKITHNVPPKMNTNMNPASAIPGFIYWLLASFILGIALVLLIPRSMDVMVGSMLQKPWQTLGWGVLALFVTPILAFITFFTFIGIPIALITLAIWIFCIFISRIITAYALGNFLFTKYRNAPNENRFLKLGVGVVISWILFEIPFLGGILSFLAILFGLGSIWIYAMQVKKGKTTETI